MRRFSIAAALVATLSVTNAPLRASPASSAAWLVSQGKESEASGNEIAALGRYADAIAIDATNEAAYAALGALRAKRSELGEAEDVYDVGLAHVPGSIDLRLGRGHVRRLRGRFVESEGDLRAAWLATGYDGSPRELAILRERIALARDQRMQAEEIACWRRLLAIAHANGDAALAKEASIQARALGLFLGEIDPVLRPIDGARKTFASVARRGG